jgi:hypothetical protein
MKALVGSVRQIVDHQGARTADEVVLQAVTNDDGVNKEWSRWTPSINFSFTVTNPNLMGKYKAGQYYMIDLTEVDPPVVTL